MIEHIVVYALLWSGCWQTLTWVASYLRALCKPAYEQFGHEPKPRKLGELYAKGPRDLSVFGNYYEHHRVALSIFRWIRRNADVIDRGKILK